MSTDSDNVEGPPTDRVYRKIREMIIHNTIPLDAKINQAEMAKRLGTSRTPVAYALHKLHSEGLVDSVPNTGFFVHRVTAKELVELFTLREALDGAIVDDLVENATEEQIDELATLFNDFRGEEEPDPIAYREADMAFHRLLVECTSNDIVKKINVKFLILDRSFTTGLMRPPKETLKEHLAIVDAIRNRDRELARGLMVAHIATTKTMLRETVRNLRNLGIDPDSIPIDKVNLDS